MNASTQCLSASLQSLVHPAVTLSTVPVDLVTVPFALVNPIAEVACTCVSPVTGEVIVTVQLDVAAPPV
jgi:hypothetical protein